MVLSFLLMFIGWILPVRRPREMTLEERLWAIIMQDLQ
jgi:hypothetical protein